MNAYMNIMVRVAAGQALARMEAIRAAQRGVNVETAAANKMSPLGHQHIQSLSKFGNQLQWTGRMILYNFTLPIVAAGVAATKWAMDQEKAMTHVRKVYGDTSAAAKQFRRESDGAMSQLQAEAKARRIAAGELNALDDAFTALSNHYGVQKKEVLEVAGAWAAAGQSGVALAKSVDATMKAIIIGDMDATQATQALISIQGQYNLSSKELMGTLSTMNSVENQTAVSMQDLIVGFSRAAGMARAAGIDVNHLSAYMAALVPATGTAANAGNALKTIISRLVNPTKESAQVIEAMGINYKGLAWQSATATEQLNIMAKAFDKLHARQQNVVASVVASRWQVNKFDVLMNELVSTTGRYAQALHAAHDQGKSFKTMQKELNTVLESDPRKLQRMWVMIQNSMADAIQPVIPFIIYLADKLGDLARSFADLDPHTQKLILFLLAVLALIGPVVKYIGALTTLYSILGVTVLKTGQFLGFFTRELVDAEGATVIARKGLLQFLAAFTLAPFKLMGKGLKFIATVFAEMVSFMFSRLAATSILFGGFGKSLLGIGGMVRTGFAVMLNAVASFLIGITPVMVGSINAIARAFMLQGFLGAIKGWATGFVGIITAGFAAAFARMAAGFGAMRTVQYVWLATSLETFKTYLLKVGTIFTLLPAFIAESMSAVWAIITIPGALSGTLIGVWNTLTAAIAARWAVLSTFVTGLWTRTMGVLAVEAQGGRMIAAWGFLTGNISKLWVLMSKRLASAWAATLAFMMSPSKVLGVFKVIGAALATFGTTLITILTSPWTIAIALIAAAIYQFRDQLGQIWNNIVQYLAGAGISVGKIFNSIRDTILKAFYSLPQGIQGALRAVVTMIQNAAQAIYGWFSYINPFAHHSPSLVENVTKGMATVQRQFAGLSNIKKYTTAAYNEIKRFGNLTAKLNLSASHQQQNEDRKTLRKAGGGVALGSYNKLTGLLNKLTPVMDKLEAKMNAQQRVVDKWQNRVDAANNKLDAQQKILDSLQNTLDGYQQKVDDAKNTISELASTPLKGMRDMENQIFANQMATTKLRYEMMQFQDVNGTLDDMKGKLDAINGAQEMMRGQQSELRAAGAGSEILGQYDKEIKKLDQQKDKYSQTATALSDMQVKLDALQREAERLDLVKAMKFDELEHRIQNAADLTKEMSFDDIMAGVKGAKQQMDEYAPKIATATAAVAKQQAVVDQLTAARDKLQAREDREQRILDKITNKYNNVKDAVDAINRAISDVISNADKMNQALDAKKSKKDKAAGYISPGLQNFLDAGKADFPDPGGKGIPPRTDWKSQKKQIEKFTEQMGADTASMFSSINPFAPLKKKAADAWAWIKDRAKGTASGIGDFFQHAFKGVHTGEAGVKALDKLKGTGKFLTKVVHDVAKVVKWAKELFAGDIKGILQNAWKGIQKAWDKIRPQLEQFKPIFDKLGPAVKNLWAILKVWLAWMAVVLLARIKVILSVIRETIGPIFSTLGAVIADIIKMIRGAVEIIVGIFSGDWKMALKGVGDLLAAPFNILGDLLNGAVRIIIGIVKGLVKGIVGFFKWLYDKLIGHSIIPDIIDGIFFWFEKLTKLAAWVWKYVLKPVYDFFKQLWDWVKPKLAAWWDGIKAAWSVLMGIGKWVWDKILAPIVRFFVGLWKDHVKPELQGWWGNIKAAWSVLTGLGKWVWDNVLSPIIDKFKNAFGAIRDWMQQKLSWITDPFHAVVKGIVTAINWIIKGINLLDKLPGVDINIGLLELPSGFERGGIPDQKRRIGSGFKTNGARAIVGEGKANHPEFVIPTDPTYRKRAKALLGMAAGKLGVDLKGAWGDTASDMAKVARETVNGVPKYGIGGWIGDHAKDAIGSIINFGGKAAVGISIEEIKAMQRSMKPYVTTAHKIADSISWDPGRQAANGGIDLGVRWIGLAREQIKSEFEESANKYVGGKHTKTALRFATSQVGKPYVWGGVGPDGYDCSGFMSAITNVLRGKNPYSRVGSTASFPWGGFSTMGPFSPNGFIIGSTRSYAGGVGHMAGTLGGVNVESRGGVGVIVGSGARGYADSGFTTRAKLTGLKYGGIVRARVGGILARIGEGGQDEAVTPLPRDWKTQGFGNGSNGTTNNFYGDLEFPNVKDGSDAKDFLKNLEILSKD